MILLNLSGGKNPFSWKLSVCLTLSILAIAAIWIYTLRLGFCFEHISSNGIFARITIGGGAIKIDVADNCPFAANNLKIRRVPTNAVTQGFSEGRIGTDGAIWFPLEIVSPLSIIPIAGSVGGPVTPAFSVGIPLWSIISVLFIISQVFSFISFRKWRAMKRGLRK